MTGSVLPPLKPIPIKDRVSMIFVYYGRIDLRDGAFVVINEVDGEDRERKHILGRFGLGSPR
jgi:CRISPR-associated protein Cas1